MTLRRKLIILFISVVVIVTILREAGVINVGYYKMTSKTTSGNSWENNSLTVTIDSSTMGTKFVNSQFNELPIVVLLGSDTLFKDDNIKSYPIIVTVDTLENGFLWIPFYKLSNFTVIGTAVYKDELIQTPPKNISLVKANFVGHLSINGSISISGICSHRQAIKLLKQFAVNSFVTETKRYFSTLD